jgi:hypothetical protein
VGEFFSADTAALTEILFMAAPSGKSLEDLKAMTRIELDGINDLQQRYGMGIGFPRPAMRLGWFCWV